MPTPLPVITALARAGALARAEALFAEAGYAAALDDPAALAVKGRLGKDRALLATGAERVRLLREAAADYAAADAIAPAPYLLINVATLATVAGDAARGESIAAIVLERLAKGGIAETPYWLAATRAEARLLRGSVSGAREALAEAIACDPDGWADHASTLRQLRLILEAQGLNADWLDPFRPPRSFHYAGHLGVAADQSATLRAEIDTVLAEERAGFGFGALAAGADIVVAEAILARGGELHVVLPTDRNAFIAQSVAPFGEDWCARFAACIEAASSVQEATRIAGAYEPRATALGADMAMGAALINARALESSAFQLLILDHGQGEYGSGVATARDGAIWSEAGRPQRLVRWPRSNDVAASAGKTEGRTDRLLAALLHITIDGIDKLDDSTFADALDSVLAPWWADVGALLPGPVRSERWGHASVHAFDSVAIAAAFAHSVHALVPPSGFSVAIAGHYGLVHLIDDGLVGQGVAALADLSHSAIAGSIVVSEPFASALAISANAKAALEPMGARILPGTENETRLFVLSAHL